MRLPKLGDQLIDLVRVLGSHSELPHFRQPPRCQPIVLRASIDELVLDKPPVDRQDSERVDLLVGLRQLGPRLVAAERQRMREVPRQLRFLVSIIQKIVATFALKF